MKKVSVYDLKTDMKNSKFQSRQKLEKVSLDLLPEYIQNNTAKYSSWLE